MLLYPRARKKKRKILKPIVALIQIRGMVNGTITINALKLIFLREPTEKVPLLGYDDALSKILSD